jgi:hypothetical protein
MSGSMPVLLHDESDVLTGVVVFVVLAVLLSPTMILCISALE